MPRWIGSIGEREFYAYETRAASPRKRIVCLVPEEGCFVGIDEIGSDLNKNLSEQEIRVVSGKTVGDKKVSGMDSDDRRLECLICGSESRLDEEFMPDYWFSLRVDFVGNDDEHVDVADWDTDEICEWIDDNLIGGLRELFHEDQTFCDQCVYELERDLESVLDDDFWAWIASTEL
jgi:hypothetical protein